MPQGTVQVDLKYASTGKGVPFVVCKLHSPSAHAEWLITVAGTIPKMTVQEREEPNAMSNLSWSSESKRCSLFPKFITIFQVFKFKFSLSGE